MAQRYLLCVLGICSLIIQCHNGDPSDCGLVANYCSCDRRNVPSYPDCRDYEAMSVAHATADCANNGGTLSRSVHCTPLARLGTCKFMAGSEVTYQRYYTSNYASVAAASDACTYYQTNCSALSGNPSCDAMWKAE